MSFPILNGPRCRRKVNAVPTMLCPWARVSCCGEPGHVVGHLLLMQQLRLSAQEAFAEGFDQSVFFGMEGMEGAWGH